MGGFPGFSLKFGLDVIWFLLKLGLRMGLENLILNLLRDLGNKPYALAR
jgi:hypothetical protein